MTEEQELRLAALDRALTFVRDKKFADMPPSGVTFSGSRTTHTEDDVVKIAKKFEGYLTK